MNMDIKDFKHTIETPFKDINESFEKQNWCSVNIGEYRKSWYLRSDAMNSQEWLFVNEEDAIQFALRWS